MLCINVAWHLQVITRANNVDKCLFILERTIIRMFIHTRENPYKNEGSAVVEILTRDRGPLVQASPASLCRVLEQEH